MKRRETLKEAYVTKHRKRTRRKANISVENAKKLRKKIENKRRKGALSGSSEKRKKESLQQKTL